MIEKKYFDLTKTNLEHSLFFYGTNEEFVKYKETGEYKVIAEDQSFQHKWPKKINAIIGPKKRRSK